MSREDKLICIDAVGIRGHGAAAVLSELLRWLPQVRPNWQWHVFLFERNLREYNDPPVAESVNLECVREGDSGIARLRWVNHGLQRRIKAIKPDACLSLANIGTAKPSVPQVVFVHQSNAFFNTGMPNGAFYKRLRLRFMRWQILRGAIASQTVIVQTDAMREKMTMYAPRLNDGRIHVIPSGYRTPGNGTDIRPEKKKLVDTAPRPRLIYVSHPSTHKNHITLLKAWSYIRKTMPDASLLLTLEPKLYKSRRKTERLYDSFLKPILDYAENIPKPDNIVWLGFLNAEEVNFALSNSNLMVFPSLSESFGLGLVEAMCAKCPIIASDLPYAHNVAGDAAVYFNPCDPLSISQTAVAVLKSDETAHDQISAGIKKSKQYSYEAISTQIIAVLEKAANRST